MAIIDNILDQYKYLTEDLANPNTKDLFLAGHPIRLACILTAYFLFATRFGPWYMKDKRPYDLKNVIKIYNILQVIANFYLMCCGLIYISSSQFNFRCQNVDNPDTPRGKWFAYVTWYYFMTKIFDLLDTVFFVLRKSDRQITSLHLHHHTLMPFVTWIGVTYLPGGQGTIIGTLNCFVHAVMYTYYFIAGLGGEYKKYLWWKKHVTELQLAQFLLVLIHSFISLFYECGYPLWIKTATLVYASIFLNLFGQFYYYNYVVKSNKKMHNIAKEKAVNGNHKNGNFNRKVHINGEADIETNNNKYRNGIFTNGGSSHEITNHNKTL